MFIGNNQLRLHQPCLTRGDGINMSLEKYYTDKKKESI